MNLGECTKSAFRNVFSNKMRTLLTMLGPPESSFGLCFTRFPSPTFSNAAIAFCCLNFLGTLSYTIGNSTYAGYYYRY